MPGREIPLITGEFYHIFNKGIFLQDIFMGKRDFKRAMELVRYYQNNNPPLRFSQFMVLSKEKRDKILKELSNKKDLLVEIICYCLMPNHFHFLLKQLKDQGISKFISQFTNSYTRYFNVKNKRSGHLFQGKFKAVRVITEEQLLHLSRYIHLNPYSSGFVRRIHELKDCSFSSLPEYLGENNFKSCNKQIIITRFRRSKSYWDFVRNQADYQKRLEQIKHLILE